MKNTRPDKGEKASSETSDEPHQDGEMGNNNRKKNRKNYHENSEYKAVHFQLSVQRPN